MVVCVIAILGWAELFVEWLVLVELRVVRIELVVSLLVCDPLTVAVPDANCHIEDLRTNTHTNQILCIIH